jgi:hypothetical protein
VRDGTRSLRSEAGLRAEVFETVRGSQLDRIDWSVIPAPDSEVAWSVRELGKLVYALVSEAEVPGTARAELLGELLDAGLPPDARLGGTFVNGLKERADGAGRSSLLMLCAQYDFAEGMQLLFARGADPLAANADHGFTIVDQAITNLNSSCLRLALEAGPYSAYVASPSGPTMPVNLLGSVTARDADQGEGKRVLSLLVEHGIDRRGLLTNFIQGGRDCGWAVDALVSLGCDPQEEGNAPAIAAAKSGKAAMLGRLFEHGVDPNLRGVGDATLMRYGANHAGVKTLLRAWRAGHRIATAVGEGRARAEKKTEVGGPL